MKTVHKDVPLTSLFNYTRIIRPYTWNHLAFALWFFTIGIPLAVLRYFLFIIALINLGLSNIFPSMKKLVGFFNYLLGFRVQKINLDLLKKSKSKILVMNHMTDFDGIPWVDLKGKFLVAPYFKLLNKLTLSRTIPFLFVNDPDIKEKIKKSIKDGNYFVMCPEGSTTNGKVALMRFARFVFSLNEPIIPVTLKVETKWFHAINLDKINDNFFINLFFFFAHPCISYKYTIYPEMMIKEEETDIEFASRVQEFFAQKLNLIASPYTKLQKHQLFREIISGTTKLKSN
ncbi:ancient ubiquitous protein [Anaeramoeba ignava]|uniref:Ancient ubiquitous protein n=1 Tax=Anaeramoeba ignava TaxID=1746090 RepID=A0A9Q0LV83_ANAIG|nr:ancient ubiquitous protein [Anaeramoeba ignava]|eukprot:Anaeramoba_ignava/a218883_107.p1 GENE.a218883_107~~a218883_107.p1  ORF type:complete len:287 (-),score=67.82 a218883_107:208-1068(-)